MSSKKKDDTENTNKAIIGVAIPMSAIGDCPKEHWFEVLDIIKSAFEDSDRYEVKIVSKSNEMAVIQDAIVNNLYHNDVVICDVSCGNPNVMFELGMRLAFDKPTIVIKDIETPYTFDTAPIRHIEYPRSLRYQSILEFKHRLRVTVDELVKPSDINSGKRTFLSNFGNLTAAKVQDQEIPEGQYIIKRLDSLMNKVDNLERNTASKKLYNNLVNDISKLPYVDTSYTFEELTQTIESAISKTVSLYNYQLPEDINKAHSDTLDSLRSHALNVVVSKYGTMSNNLFEKAFKEAYSSAYVPL